MENNIEHLKTEVNEIKQSLNELKNNISFSEIEKKDKAEILRKQAEETKQKVQEEIKILESKTDNTSKMKKEEAETLLNSFNDITVLYNSITNSSSNILTQSYNQEPKENKNILTKTKEWLGEQRDNVQDKIKRKTEWWKNLLRTLWFAATWIWAVTLAYKWIKKLFWWWKDDNKDDNKEKDNNNKEKNNDENNTETSEKTEKKDEFWDKWYRKALKWLWIAWATWWWLYTISKWSNLRASERKPRNEEISNGSNKEETSNSSDSEKESENNSDKKESNENTTKKDTKNSTNSNESKEVDNGKNTYTNPISGLTYKRIDQVTDPAGKLRYSWKRSGKTVANIWCLLASGCTVTSALCPEVTLTDCFNNVRHWTADKAVAKMSNNKWKSEALLSWEHGNRTKAQEQKAKEEIIENLKKWYPAVIGARHSGIDGINNSIVSQHYRAILGIRTENGKNEFFVWNTYKNGSWGWMDEDKIFKNMIHASIFTPNQA